MPVISLTNNRPEIIIRDSGAGVGPTDRIDGAQYAEALSRLRDRGALKSGVAMYIHLPFCPSRCLSCDHHATITHDPRDIDRYLDALDAEMDLVADRLGGRLPLLQLHLGGGTPNYLSDPQLVRLMEIVERHFAIDDNTETSLEANPKRSSATQLELLRGLGFRRIQFEVRDLDATVQKALGRALSPQIVDDAFGNARDVGFDTVGMDLVYGLPNQTVRTVESTVRDVLALHPDRIACFSHMRRPDTFSHQRAIDAGSLPSLADKLAMFNHISDGLQEQGYQWIGLDCFATETDGLTRAQQDQRLHRNWIGYTEHESSDLLGFGINAVTELDDLCVQSHQTVSDWAAAVNHGEFPVSSGLRLSEDDRERRRALNDLLCNMKLRDYSALRRSEGSSPSTLDELERNGMVQVSSEGVSVTAEGRYLLHQVWGDASPLYRWGGGG